MKATYEPLRCKFCGSSAVVRYGKQGSINYWWCKACRRKFADNDALPFMRTPLNQIGSALSSYYEGMSLASIRRHLAQMYENTPSKSTLYAWLTDFTQLGIEKAKGYRPDVGSVWVADETMLRIGGKWVWFWDIIDARTRFLLASYISTNRTAQNARILMEKAALKAGGNPRTVITDKLSAYLDGIELAFGADAKHIQSKPFTVENSTNVIERFHGTLKGRTKVMRGIKTLPTARLLTDGYLVFYNYFRPHESLNDRTPAQTAGVRFPYLNWLDLVKAQGEPMPLPSSRVSLGRPHSTLSHDKPCGEQCSKNWKAKNTRC